MWPSTPRGGPGSSAPSTCHHSASSVGTHSVRDRKRAPGDVGPPAVVTSVTSRPRATPGGAEEALASRV